MNGQPERSQEELEALMVFLANETLDGEERAAVEDAVAADPALRDELAALRSIRAGMRAEVPGFSPGEMGLARLMRDIASDSAASQSMAPAANPAPRQRVWMAAAVVAAGLFIAQSAYVFATRDDGFGLAGGGVTVQAEHTITLAFVETATEAEIRAVLLDLDLNVVDGPSALGLYVVAAQNEADRAVALEQLQRRADIVESAE
jgi:anti-sigma factor RsiW